MTMFRLSKSPLKLLTSSLTASALALAACMLCTIGSEGIAHAQQPAQGAQPLPTPPSATPNSNCPPGSWFCGDAQGQAGTQGGAKDLQPLPSSETAAPPPGTNGVTYSGQAPVAPPVVIYQPAPSRPTVVFVGAPPAYKYTPRPAPVHRSEWGLNLHIEGEPIGGRGAASDAGMGGLGFGVRYRPSPYAAIEPDLDFVGGRDYNGDKRGEVGFTPQTSDSYSSYANGTQHDYTYFGAQAGIGLEFRISKHFALNTDVRGFVRGRVDQNAQGPNPDYEFTSSDGRRTNSSGGAIINGGMTFYF
ncbi:MAG: hypothetical protein ABI461_16895 [Polyangiaceae bacterium]